MSSVLPPHFASNCIDGTVSSMCHSQSDTQWPWLSIELPGRPSTVNYVVVTNRINCCWDLLSPFQLWIGATAGDYDSPTSASCGVDEVNLTTAENAGPFSFRCADINGSALSGDYLTLVLPGIRTLHIAELDAYSTLYSPSLLGPVT